MRKTRVRTRQSRRRWFGRPVSVHQTNKLPHAATYGCTTSQGGFATERPASPSLRRLPPALAPLCAKFSLSAAAAASSERQTIRQTPASALPCLALPAWPPWKIVSPQNFHRSCERVCVCAACEAKETTLSVHSHTRRTHSPFDPALAPVLSRQLLLDFYHSLVCFGDFKGRN
jgi:hypothetical protein